MPKAETTFKNRRLQIAKAQSEYDLVGRVVKEGDVTPLMMADAWVWAYESKLRLVSGVFDIDGHEYQVEPMQTDARVIVVRKSTQMGFSEAFVLRSLHKLIMKQYKLGILYLFPTKDDVTDFSTSRFKPLIMDNFQMIGMHIKDTDRANLKRIGRAYIFFRSGKLGQRIEGGDKTSSKLKSIPVDCVVFDEWDEMDPGAQDMAISRMQHSEHKHEIYLANPTIPDYGIDKMWQVSDQRVWMIKCGHCNKYTCLELEFPDCLQRRGGGETVRVCRKCGREIFCHDGTWVPAYRDCETRGYWISHLNSKYVDPGTLLDTWESESLHSSSGKLANFYRLKLGMPYIGALDRLSVEDVYNLCKRDPMLLSHPGPCALGVDVGSVLHAVIMDRPTEHSRRMVFCGRFRSFTDLYDTVKNFNISCCVIDKYPETRKARDWGKSVPFQTYLCEYRDSTHGFARWDEKTMETVVNRTEVCDETHNLVVTPGLYQIPRMSEEIKRYAEQMTNTAKVEKSDPNSGLSRYVYIKLNTDDHYRHATNYAWLASTRIGVSTKSSRNVIDLNRRMPGKAINWMTL